MIFDENFDKLLWLMLAGNEKNRENLVSFIRSLPQEIYMKINSVIYDCKEEFEKFLSGEVSKCNDRRRVRDRMISSDGYIYEYEFNYDGFLDFKMWRWKGCYVEEKFELFLSANTVSILNNMSNFERIYVGSFYCNSIDYEKSSVIQSNDQYYLVKTPIGYIVELKDRHNIRRKILDYRRKCPSEIDLTDFSTSDRVYELVRTKKRKKCYFKEDSKYYFE